MMKSGWKYVLIALATVVSCVDRSYGGMQEEEIFVDTTEPIPVKTYIGSAETILPKGSGVITDPREWDENSKFFIYAFNNNMFTSYRVTSKTDGYSCLIDGSRDVQGTLAGKKAYLDPTSNVVLWSGPDDQVIYPYGTESGIVYDFFAYYVDDIVIEESDITRGDDNVTIQIEIDGSQDVMSSKARVLEDQLVGFLDEDERLEMEGYCYGYHAAKKGIDPVFIFKHHLTKLNFKIKPGYNSTGQRKVEIHKIEVRSRYDAQFTVADKGSTDNLGLVFNDTSYVDMTVREDDGSEFAEGRYVVTTLATSSSRGSVTEVGRSLLVAPADRYDAYVYMTETYMDGTPVQGDGQMQRVQMDVLNPEGFAPGNGYEVSISVYGSTKIETEVTLKDWNDGGKIPIDDEDRWGNDGEF